MSRNRDVGRDKKKKDNVNQIKAGIYLSKIVKNRRVLLHSDRRLNSTRGYKTVFVI